MADNKSKKRRVVTRKTGGIKNSNTEFSFTREMIPSFSLNGTSQSGLMTSYRDKAWAAFERLDLPTTSEEPWRRTDIRKLQASKFELTAPQNAPGLPGVPKELTGSEEYGGSVILSPSASNLSLSPKLIEQGVIFTDLATAAIKHADILEKILGRLVDVEEGKFAAMAGAFASQGALLYVPAGVQVEQPFHSVMWTPGSGIAYFSHLLIWVEDRASVTYIHESASPSGEDQALHAGIVEIHIGKSASLKFVDLQSFGDNMWNFAHKRVNVNRDGKLEWIIGAVGSRLTKDFSEINLVGEGAEGRMSGFYFTDNDQHFDYDTQQNHMAPHTSSDLLFKGALTGSSRSVWQGMIYVAPDAQKTDGYQSNRTLMLSDDARADSIPGLEILADDVRCTHGATMGTIDSEESFDLGSRV
ncbi:MAG: SufD family Fe-S cluster assembly protein, partial [Chloroflexi bacterium]|nr:SufD family Fe-S cluster assembly protein [Chloroflexota bacterium]